ncbi:hypothetical protein PAAG_05914 [Paracoccidioides lutzii Pb01]|uniref:Zn(2)-C6 fungal-type domain-containing protein n=1 Tax=Paracoccidioides lutzii (strain ATCC MYA-826 / Pb01) TaxID=502779 RepID=C1H573_PARBA|nr:hypothetical protein PAAG_05914 [Paracoccidioides lutzii Pb01]EEH34867.2 hypothetical protein PAAG_05914 [Paracoccidioides lutzii Pb01]
MENTVDPRPLLKSVSEGGCPDDYRGESVQEEQTRGSARKRKRTVLTTSCELCRQRKVRCDRGEPSCGWCTRNGRESVYRDKMLPTFRVLHTRELELKVNTLEAMLEMLGRRLELHISEHETERGSRQPPPPDQVVADQQGFATASEPRRSDLSETLSQDPSASIVEAASERVQRFRPSALISVQSLVNVNATESANEPASSEMIESSSEGARETMSELHLPSRDTLYVIVDLFFKHVNPWCPILERAATVEKVFRAPVCDEADLVLLYAIKQKILLYAFEHTSISALQALTILALDLLGMSYGPQSCTILSMIVRNVMQLGLGVETAVALGQPSHESPGTLHQFMQPPSTPWVENEGRRRLFWMTFILYRYACVDMGSDSILDIQQTDRQLPCRYDLFSKNQPVETRRFIGPERPEITINRPENLGSFSYHCEVLRILNRIHKFLRTPIDIGYSVDVDNWQATFRDLDQELDRYFFPSFAAMQRCIAAVESLLEIVQDVVNTAMLDLLGPHFAFSLWVSARVLVLDASVSNTDVNSNVWFFISTLDKMGQHWGVAKKYAKVLENILEEAQEAKRVAAMTQATAINSQSPPLLAPKSPAEMREYASSSLGYPQSLKRVQLILLHRSAYELSIILFQRYSSGVHPPSVKTVTPNELECYEVFDFFNYPPPPVPVAHQASSLTTNTGSETPASNGAEGWTRVKTHIVSTNFTYVRSDSEFQSLQG